MEKQQADLLICGGAVLTMDAGRTVLGDGVVALVHDDSLRDRLRWH